ncbi:tetratricopeptide repeat protein [Hyphococcus luteus]|uniref:Protein kinase domain-containing protein n=1 Tax=Hyphococcus luteus TaxID=2058213 RepID=A0A2S7KAR3_9PROT|nr:tetratricopeptide repeat protein [Marinicaulis flavus]PQA89610.1 hypothetical protein CW354_01725 [Marinicaulis flavus]
MTAHSANEIEVLMDRLLDLGDSDRRALLVELENDDPALAKRMRRLLSFVADEETLPGEVHQSAPALMTAFRTADRNQLIGQRLGAYEITHFVRRGGMGAVYRGERADGAFEQSVAIKILPARMASSERRDMFERERRYLATLEHPNIARIIDAGMAPDGSLYFIMEFIDGEPFDVALEDVNDDGRLRFFTDLCNAVSFCHRSLIAHGDLKPSNIFISDGRLRLLDFGVGRLIGPSAATPSSAPRGYSRNYAAPEQITSGEPSVAADIYSLGRLFERLIVKEKSDTELAAIAAKACAREPTDRYGSVDALKADLRAYQSNHVISALPQTAGYRMLKFTRRNVLIIASFSLIVLTLAAGLFTTSWQYRTATRQAARAEAVAAFVKNMFEEVDPEEAGVKPVTLRQVMDDSADRLANELSSAPGIYNEIKAVIASGYFGVGEYERALQMRTEVLEYAQGEYKPPNIELVGAQNAIAAVYRSYNKLDEAITLCRNSLKQLKALRSLYEKALADTHFCLSMNLAQKGGAKNIDEALRHRRQALAIYSDLYGDASPEYAKSLASLGMVVRAAEDYVTAAQNRETALAIAERHGLLMVPSFIRTRCNLALDYVALGRHAEAISANKKCLQLKKERLGDDHPEIATSLNNIARLNLQLGEINHALNAVNEGLAVARESIPSTNFTRLALEINKAAALWQSGEPELASILVSDVVERMSDQLGPEHGATKRANTIKARILLETGDVEEAARLLSASLEGLSQSWRADALLWRAEVAYKQGDHEGARKFADEAVRMRRTLPIFTPWQIAESEFVRARAADDSAEAIAAAEILVSLPPNHIRRIEAQAYLDGQK